MDAVPFTPLTAEFLDDMIENIESLASGSGLNDNSITSDKIDWATIDFKTRVIPGSLFSTAGSKTFDTGLGRKPRMVKLTALPSTRNTNFLLGHGACDGDLSQWTTTAAGSSGGISQRTHTSGFCMRLTTAATHVSLMLLSITGLSETGVITFNVHEPLSLDIAIEVY